MYTLPQFFLKGEKNEELWTPPQTSWVSISRIWTQESAILTSFTPGEGNEPSAEDPLTCRNPLSSQTKVPSPFPA